MKNYMAHYINKIMKNNITNLSETYWFSTYLYLLIFAVVILAAVMHICFFKVQIPSPLILDGFISIMVTVEGAIIGIVLTMTLIALQMAAVSYSGKLIILFMKNPDIWIILAIYIGSILIQTHIFLTSNYSYTNNIVVHILYISINLSLLVLFPYTWKTFYSLTPSSIITSLANNISLKDFDFTESEIPLEKNPFCPLFDSISKSIINYDYSLASFGIYNLMNIFLNLLGKIIDNDQKYRFVDIFLTQFFSLFELAIKMDARDIIKELIRNISMIYLQIVELYFSQHEGSILKRLKIFGIRFIESGKDMLCVYLLQNLKYIAKVRIESYLEGLPQNSLSPIQSIIILIGDIGLCAKRRDRKNILDEALLCIDSIKDVVLMKNFTDRNREFLMSEFGKIERILA